MNGWFETLSWAREPGEGALSGFSPVLAGIWISFPLAVGGVLHMLVVKLKLFNILDHPLSLTLFGRNKTWRGLVVMPLATLIGMGLLFGLGRGGGALEWAWAQGLLRFLTQSGLAENPIGIALAVGFAYVLFELPNSWVKRRLGVPPGKLPTQHRIWFAVGDQLDSTLGCALAYGLMTRVDGWTLGICLFLGPAIHVSVNLVLFLLKIRKNPL